ncbi:hypothetical protein JKI95_09240 [Corynebacterium aquatimens]|uniref:hypothetical protein n=1 Tax=Corynebacterium TaxID=1716 RepID=UPI001F3BC530|nr:MULTISPECIES: hypothetical protein [Corynebacterium]QYH19319.1 hypothetical protein JKI95_09240 [Corynebacterium aquatimens]UIZ91786.1 hypothetical protein JZY91_08660 [Corynebacterium sp. CNCTC7651]
MPPNPNSVAAEHRGHKLQELSDRVAELEHERDRWREFAREWEKRAKRESRKLERQRADQSREQSDRDNAWQRRLLAERYGLSASDAELFLNRDSPEENERIAARLATRKRHSPSKLPE